VEGISYGAFIVPGLIMLSLLTQSIANASFGIYFPKFTGTIYELLSAPISYLEIVISYVGAAATKSIVLGVIILATAWLFVPLKIDHPVWMVVFLVLTAGDVQPGGVHHRDLGRRLRETAARATADRHTRSPFLGGSFYSIDMLPPFWQKVSLFKPGGLPDQRLPLELLQHRRRERRGQPRHDRRVHARVAGDRRLDVQDRLQAQETSTAPLGLMRSVPLHQLEIEDDDRHRSPAPAPA